MDLWMSGCDVIVIPTNGVGVMGAGIAKQCADRFPGVVKPYQDACRSGLQLPGHCFSWTAPSGVVLTLLPTKRHWRDTSRLEDVELGLRDLHRRMVKKPLTVALPPVGCGLGGLQRNDVMLLISRIFTDETRSRLVLCGW